MIMSKQNGKEELANRRLFSQLACKNYAYDLNLSYCQLEDKCKEIRPEGKYFVDCKIIFEFIPIYASQMKENPIFITRKVYEVYTADMYNLPSTVQQEEILKRLTNKRINLDDYKTETIFRTLANANNIVKDLIETGRYSI